MYTEDLGQPSAQRSTIPVGNLNQEAHDGIINKIAQITTSEKMQELAAIESIREMLRETALMHAAKVHATEVHTTEDADKDRVDQNDDRSAIEKNLEKAVDKYHEILDAISGQPPGPSDHHSGYPPPGPSEHHSDNPPSHYELVMTSDLSHHWPF